MWRLGMKCSQTLLIIILTIQILFDNNKKNVTSITLPSFSSAAEVQLLPATADYWKSQGRKFCDFCKCWIADNKPSIEFHEGGKKHKENVGKRLREIHKTSAKQARQHRKFEDDIKKMETAAMAAYLKDVENNTKDLTAERIIREKLSNAEKKDNSTTNVPQPQLALPEASPRYKNREFHPAGKGNRGDRGDQQRPVAGDPCDPSSASRPRSSGYGKSSGNLSSTTSQGEATKVQGKSKAKGKRGKRGAEDDGTSDNKTGRQIFVQKLWYEALSPEGYTYYWHVETNETTWEVPEEGFATIAEQEEEAKEQALQEELLAEIAKDEERKKEETAEERRANAEREKQKEIRKQREQEEAAEAAQDSNDEPNVTYRRDYSVPERPQPYGTWKTIQVIKRKPVDLELPKKQQYVQPAAAVPTLDREMPVRIFKEKTISKIEIAADSNEEGEAAPSTFKKRKFAKKNVRKRLDDD